MTEANLTDVMDQIGVALGTIAGLRVFDFPPLSAQPPFAFVNLPERVDYHLTYQGGAGRMTIEVYVGVANQVDRSSRDLLAAYAAHTGTLSIRAALETATIGQHAQVMFAQFATIALASASYAGLTFSVDVVM